MVRHPRIALILAAAALAVIVSGCGATLKPGSLRATQPAAGGPVHVHYVACADGVKVEEGGEPEFLPCGDVPQELKEEFEDAEEKGLFSELEEQKLLAIAIPIGAAAPATITAVGIGSAPTFTYTRNAEVAASFAKIPRKAGDKRPWPPAGTEIVGYLSPYSHVNLEKWQWNVDADFGLPPQADGGAYGGPFTLEEADGLRVGGRVQSGGKTQEIPQDRPIDCEENEGVACQINEGASTAVTNLNLAPAAPVKVFPGGRADLSFPAAYASSAAPPAPYALAATTSIPKATATTALPTFSAAVDPTTHRAALAQLGVTVAVPKGAKPGAYPVSLTAVGPGSGTITAAGALTVVKAKLKFGKVTLNRRKGTALISVTVPSAGTLTVKGKGVVGVTKKAGKAKTLKVTLKTKGPTAAALATVGQASLKPTFSFKPTNGAAVSKPRLVAVKTIG